MIDGVHDQPRQNLGLQSLAALRDIPVFDPINIALGDDGTRLVWPHPHGKRVVCQPHALVGLAGFFWAGLVDTATVLQEEAGPTRLELMAVGLPTQPPLTAGRAFPAGAFWQYWYNLVVHAFPAGVI